MILTLLITVGILASFCLHIMQYQINERLKAMCKEQDRQLTAQANIIGHLYRSKASINAQLN